MNDTPVGRSRPEDSGGGPKRGLALDRRFDIGMKGTAQATVDDTTWLFEQTSRLRARLADTEAERAALLATRDRYEAALRRLVKAVEDQCDAEQQPVPVSMAVEKAVLVAREALAAAQEGDRT
jgi:hypothetical protein